MKPGTYYPEIDILKGIGIFLVVLGHSNSPEFINRLIYSFHMPLFFFVCGFTFKPREPFTYLKSKFVRIMIPFYFFSFISYFQYAIRNQDDLGIPPIDFAKGTLLGMHDGYYLSWNGVLWFLPCIFILLNTMNLIYTLKSFTFRGFLMSSIVCISLMYSLNRTEPLPFHMECAGLMIPFFLAGQATRKHRGDIRSSRLVKSSIIILSILAVGVQIYCQNYVEIMRHTTGDWRVFYPVALFIIMFMYILSSKATDFTMLKWLGINSLAIFCIHFKFKALAVYLTNIAGFSVGLTVFLSMLILAILPILFLNRYIPWAVGKAS